MQVIRWDRLMYETGVPKGEGKLRTSLAGNAFSAFSIGIIALAARIASQVPATLSLNSVDLASQDSVLSGCETPQRKGGVMATTTTSTIERPTLPIATYAIGFLLACHPSLRLRGVRASGHW